MIIPLSVLLLSFVTGISTMMPSAALADNLTSDNILGNLTEFRVDTSNSEPELPRGVPFTLHLSYKNGSFLSTGPIDYKIKFDFGEPFIISAFRKGTFDNATLIGDDTLNFHSRAITRGENKTGVILFSFNSSGLAEQHRVANVTTNVTVLGLPQTARNMGLINENSTGTFANTSLFINRNLFNNITGIDFQPGIPNFVNNVSINTLRNGLVNLSLSQIAGTFHALSTDRANVLIRSVPPIAPSNTTTSTTTIEVNSSYIDLLGQIVNLTNGILKIGEEVYNETVPCISLESIEPIEPQTIPGSLLYKFLVKIKNCSNHFELVKMKSQDPISTKRFYDIDKFDMTSHNIKDLHLYALIPAVTIPGFYGINLKGNVVVNLLGLEAIITDTNGTAPLLVLNPP